MANAFAGSLTLMENPPGKALITCTVTLECIGWYILLVDGLHRHYSCIKIGQTRRYGVDVGAQRSVRARRRIWIEKDPPQNLVVPVIGNLVRWVGIRPV